MGEWRAPVDLFAFPQRAPSLGRGGDVKARERWRQWLTPAVVMLAVAVGTGPALADSPADVGVEGSVDRALQADLDEVVSADASSLVGQMLRDKIVVFERHGWLLDTFSLEIAGLDDQVYRIQYQHNEGTLETIERATDGLGHVSDRIVAEEFFVTPDGPHRLSDPQRNSDMPTDEFFAAINRIDTDHRDALEATSAVPVGPLSALDPVGRALANSAAIYDARQNYADLTFGILVTRQGHNACIDSWSSWNGPHLYLGDTYWSDPGDDYDGMDAEYDPTNMYTTGVAWQPNTATYYMPWWHGYHNIAMTSAGNHGKVGADYQKPDKCAKYNDLYLYIAPKSSAYYGYGLNLFANYIHTWDWTFATGVTFSFGYGSFGISWKPPLTGSWEKNRPATIII